MEEEKVGTVTDPASLLNLQRDPEIESLESGVTGFHDLHVCELTDSKVIAKLNVTLFGSDRKEIERAVQACKDVLRKFGIHSSTMSKSDQISTTLGGLDSPVIKEELTSPLLTIPVDVLKFIILMIPSPHFLRMACVNSLCRTLVHSSLLERRGENPVVTASSNLPSPNGLWNSGCHPPQWIEFDLGMVKLVSKISMRVEQSPPGWTLHAIKVSASSPLPREDFNNERRNLWDRHRRCETCEKRSLQQNGFTLHVFDGDTKRGDVLEATWDQRPMRYVRIETRISPSWVAWQCIEIT